MKILVINPFSKFAAVRQFNISKSFANKGNKVILMLPKYDQYSGFKKVPIEKVKNLKIIHPLQIKSKLAEIGMIFYIPSAILKTLFKKIDIIHATRPLPFSGLIGYILSKIKKVPLRKYSKLLRGVRKVFPAWFRTTAILPGKGKAGHWNQYFSDYDLEYFNSIMKELPDA